MSSRRLLHIFLTSVIFAVVLLFSFKTNISAAISCPTGLTQQCAAPVTYTKDVVSNSSFQTSPTNICFEYVQPGDVLRTDTYVSHVYYNCRNGNTRDENGEVITVCDFTTTCQIAPVCTCVGSAPTSCTNNVTFANKNLEIRESSVEAGYTTELYSLNIDALVSGDTDFRTGAAEDYDVYKSDANGNALSNGNYISIVMSRDFVGDGAGNNIDSAVLVDRSTGVRYPATVVVSKMVGSAESAVHDDQSYNALGEPDARWTLMGDRVSRITLGYTYENCQSTPTPAPSPSGQCVNTKIYTNSWVELTPEAFKGLSSGIQVYFCVNGVTNSSVFDAGRFTINGVTRTQTTVKRPNTSDFCDLYTIPANTYTFKVQGELHHTVLGWL